jgi:hypothetical protein
MTLNQPISAYQASVNAKVLDLYNDPKSVQFIMHLLMAYVSGESTQATVDNKTCAIMLKPSSDNMKGKPYPYAEGETPEDRILFASPNSDKLISNVAKRALVQLAEDKKIRTLNKTKPVEAKVVSPDAVSYKKKQVIPEMEGVVIPEPVPATIKLADVFANAGLKLAGHTEIEAHTDVAKDNAVSDISKYAAGSDWDIDKTADMQHAVD